MAKKKVPVEKSRAFRNKVEKVMREWKAGTLKGRDGKPIKNRRQAIAIALSEAKRYVEGR